ncbi:MAG: TonB-dependent receptor [Candidatus Zixiibacteriota bacterium]|nr:MAG: TonB-dependent receptor [candidate division Zixibacteria bacterium]
MQHTQCVIHSNRKRCAVRDISLILTLAAALLLAATASVGATSIKGRVVDADGQPLVGVSVVTNLTGYGVMSDEDGRFELVRRDDITRLTFSSVGYESRQFRVDDVPETIALRTIYYRGADILVTADRAEGGITPIAFDDFSADEISRDYTVGEFPLLLSSTPNLYSYSDAGSALGYSYTRIRGFDDKRIVTYINGVPLNDPEDQATYFVDLPDFAANVSDIQVQRGVGNSLYGDASFGGSINICTRTLNRERKTVLTSGYGEYTSNGSRVSDIYKQSVEYSSGLIDGRWLFTGRFSRQKTGGYRYNSWYEGWSYYFSLARLDPRMTTEFHIYGGPMRMHLAYYGVTRDAIEADRRANPLAYNNETDNFNQPHYQLHNVYRVNDRTTLYNTLYYIRGKGYYEQFKDDRDYFEYNISPTLTNIDPSTAEPYESGDVVRQQWVEKNQTGWNPRVDIAHEKGQHSLGGSFYYFDSDHWGQVVWAEHIDGPLDPRHRYYQYYGKKYVASVYGQEYYHLTDRLSAQLTAQLRYQKYDFDQERMGAFMGHQYNVNWLFFSPRIGFNYHPGDRMSLYANFAVSSRTPTDAAIYDANDPYILPSLEIESVIRDGGGDVTEYVFGDPTAESEHVYNIELGGQYRTPRYSAGVNLFWMDFRDEIIPYGGLSENINQLITTNADRTVHTGIELTGSYKPVDQLTLSGNLAYNYNRVRDYVGEIDVYLPDWSAYRLDVDYKDKTIPGFPDILGNLVADYAADSWRVTGRLRVVGQQYMELFNIDSLAIDPHVVSSISASYRVQDFLGTGDLTFQGRVDNLFNHKYETSGYGWAYGLADGVGEPVTLIHEAEYFVAAERSYYGQVVLELF